MYVTKRNGQRENVHFDKITERIQKLIWSEGLDPVLVAQKVVASLYPGIKGGGGERSVCRSITVNEHFYGRTRLSEIGVVSFLGVETWIENGYVLSAHKTIGRSH